VARLEGLIPYGRIHVLTNGMYAGEIRNRLPEIPSNQVVAEPCGRDTAACIGLASAMIARLDPDGVLAVLPADHVIEPRASFQGALAAAARAISQQPGSLLTFGIPPSRPATGYGYIERGPEIGQAEGRAFFRVDSFREKPDAQTAARFLEQGNFLWNAGIFVFRARTLLSSLERHLPELADRLPLILESLDRTGAIPEPLYAALPKVSIDYGVLEREREVLVIQADFEWDDVGSFAALERVLPGDAAGNRALGRVLALDAAGNVAIAGADHQLALIGVKDLVVVHTADATLVCRKQDAERVKELVERLRSEQLDELL
jgi:mannose-1-phosphate guanylyltransferase